MNNEFLNDPIMPKSAKQTVLDLFYGTGPIVLMFGVIYACSLTFVYIEGDDATSVAFHAMGRNAALQPPYSPYHGMMDVFLGLLPANETFIRHVAMTLTAAAGTVMVCLAVILIRQCLPNVGASRLAARSIFILLCTPEIFYLGLVYTPSLAAMSLVLAAHLIIRTALKEFRKQQESAKYYGILFVLSAIIFGIGVACRWDIGTYLVFIVADLLLNFEVAEKFKSSLKFAIIWAASAFAASLAAVWLSGYGYNEIRETLALAKQEVLRWDSWFALFGTYQTLFTPAFVIFFAAGWIALFRRHWRLAILSVSAIFVVSPYLFSREPKMILPALPGLWLAVAAGVDFIFDLPANRKFLRVVPAAVFILMLLPWLVGLAVFSSESAWGPGFGIKNAASPIADAPDQNLIHDQVSERTISVNRWQLAFSGGFAIPTPEGPRPLGGNAYVLTGGEWRKLAILRDAERRSVIETALNNGYDLLQDDGNSYLVAKFIEMGFWTNDPKRDHSSSGTIERTFFNDEGKSVRLQILKVRKSLFDHDQLIEIQKSNPSGKVVLYSGYTSTIRKLVETAPESISALGPFSAVVDLEKLLQKLQQN